MIHGNSGVFSIHASVKERYAERGLLALGRFNICVNGICYGVQADNASFLACSADELSSRILNRGNHTAPFSITANALEIANAFTEYFFGTETSPLGLSRSEFSMICFQLPFRVKWIPDGDSAFDDGSHIFHFDVSDKLVRLVCFRRLDNEIVDIVDSTIDSNVFYSVLCLSLDSLLG